MQYSLSDENGLDDSDKNILKEIKFVLTVFLQHLLHQKLIGYKYHNAEEIEITEDVDDDFDMLIKLKEIQNKEIIGILENNNLLIIFKQVNTKFVEFLKKYKTLDNNNKALIKSFISGIEARYIMLMILFVDEIFMKNTKLYLTIKPLLEKSINYLNKIISKYNWSGDNNDLKYYTNYFRSKDYPKGGSKTKKIKSRNKKTKSKSKRKNKKNI